MTNGTDLYDDLTRRAKRGPRWKPQIHQGTCCRCDSSGDVIRWSGYRWCRDCLPDLPRALMNAPDAPEATRGH